MQMNIRFVRVTVLLLVMTVALCVVMSACDNGHPDSKTSLGSFGDVKTITHDGHKFVIADYNGKIGGIIHHPDCCKAAK